MLPEFQCLFVDPEDHSPLSFEGEWLDDCWWNGVLCSSRGETWPVVEGIPDFVRESIEGVSWSGPCSKETYERNWKRANDILVPNSWGREVAEECVRQGRPALDIASGPGGGFMPGLLQLDPRLPVMATDASSFILQGWKRYLEREGMSFAVCFAAFDARKMPLASGSVEVMTSVAGFGNIHGPFLAIREAARILADDGIIYTWDSDLDMDAYRVLMAKKGVSDLDRRPGSTLGWAEAFQECGLRVVRREFIDRYKIEGENSVLGKLADEFGIELWSEDSMFWLAKRHEAQGEDKEDDSPSSDS